MFADEVVSLPAPACGDSRRSWLARSCCRCGWLAPRCGCCPGWRARGSACWPTRGCGSRWVPATTTRRPRSGCSLPLVLANYWHQLGLLLDPGDANDVETISAIIRITGGNFRLIERLMTQVARVMEINQLDTLDPDVIHAARQMLVVGTN